MARLRTTFTGRCNAGTTRRCAIYIGTPANQRMVIKSLKISSRGTDSSAVPGDVEIARYTAAPSDGTAITAAERAIAGGTETPQATVKRDCTPVASPTWRQSLGSAARWMTATKEVLDFELPGGTHTGLEITVPAGNTDFDYTVELEE